MSDQTQTVETDYAELEFLYNQYMTPALTAALRDVFDHTTVRASGCGLDVGCGPGGIMPPLAAASAARHIVGFDLSAAHLAAARRLVAQHDLAERVSLAAVD